MNETKSIISVLSQNRKSRAQNNSIFQNRKASQMASEYNREDQFGAPVINSKHKDAQLQ